MDHAAEVTVSLPLERANPTQARPSRLSNADRRRSPGLSRHASMKQPRTATGRHPVASSSERPLYGDAGRFSGERDGPQAPKPSISGPSELGEQQPDQEAGARGQGMSRLVLGHLADPRGRRRDPQ